MSTDNKLTDLEQAANDYAKDCIGEYDSELQQDFEDIKGHFLAGSRYQSQSTVPGDIVERLSNANPFRSGGNSTREDKELGYIEAVDKLSELLSSQPVEGKEDGWEVVDDLPVETKRVLVFTKSKTIIIAGFIDTDKRWYSHGEDITELVTHWKPLPNPPKSSIKDNKQ